MAVIDYTCITSVGECSQSVRLLRSEVPYYGRLHYFHRPKLRTVPSK